MENLKIFNTQEEYQAWKDSDDYVYPNVCKVGEEVVYNNYPDPLWIEALEDITVFCNNANDGGGVPLGSYSYDKINWTSFKKGSNVIVRKGQKLYCKNSTFATSHYAKMARFTISGKCNIGGAIVSMVFGDDYLKEKTGYPVADHPNSGESTTFFYSCFEECKVVHAKDLILPPYVSYGVYMYMFKNCTELISAPKLPAKTLYSSCYASMFNGCTKLSKAPSLLASSHESGSYSRMFNGCSSLSYIKAMSNSFSGYNSLEWVEGVSPTGTFIASVKITDFTRGVSDIPEGWDLYLYDEENDRYVVKFSVNGIPYEFYTDEPRYVKWSEFIDSEQNTNDFRKGYWNDASETAVTVRGIDNVLLSGKIVNSFENIVLNASYTIGEPTETTEVTESTNEEE